MSSGRRQNPVANRSMISRSSNAWKSLVEGSPLGPRSARSWRSRSAKKASVARTTSRSSVKRAANLRRLRSGSRPSPGYVREVRLAHDRGRSRCWTRTGCDVAQASFAQVQLRSKSECSRQQVTNRATTSAVYPKSREGETPTSPVVAHSGPFGRNLFRNMSLVRLLGCQTVDIGGRAGMCSNGRGRNGVR
jgi:hypothetical protein